MADSLMRRLRFAHRPLIGSALSVAAITAFARLNGGLREMLIAREFGTSSELEVFLVGFGLVTMVTVAVNGGLSHSFVPTAFRADRSEAQGVREAFTAVLPRVLGMLLVIAGALALVAPLLPIAVGGGFSPEDQHRVRDIIVMLAPLVLIGGLSAMCSAGLNARERFALGAVPPVLNPLVTLVVVALVAEPTATTLALAFLGGALAELLAAGALLLMTWPRHRGMETPETPARPEVPAHADRRMFFRTFFPLAVAYAVQASDTVVDQAVATHLGEGRVAVLAFGSRIPGFLAAVGITAVGTVVLPQFSRLAASGDRAALATSVRVKVGMAVALASVIALALTIVSRPVLDVVFGGGQFTQADVSAAAAVQSVAIWQLPFLLAVMVLTQVVTAQGRSSAILVVNLVTVAVNLGLDVLFGHLWGAPGIALATLVVIAIRSGVYWNMVIRDVSGRSAT